MTFDVPFAPYNERGQGVDGRNYDFVGIARACDFLFIMSYDLRSQVFTSDDDRCIAQANGDVFVTWSGVQAFLELGINASQLVLGKYQFGCKRSDDDS